MKVSRDPECYPIQGLINHPIPENLMPFPDPPHQPRLARTWLVRDVQSLSPRDSPEVLQPVSSLQAPTAE